MQDLQPITVAPGITTEDSDFAAAGRYVDGENVRFWKGLPQKMGGNQPYNQKLVGAARGFVSWRALDGTRLAAWGTDKGLFLLYEDAVFDITPTTPGRTPKTLNNPFRFVTGSSVVRVLDLGHGMLTGDRVQFVSNLTAGGNRINGIYPVTRVSEGFYDIETGVITGPIVGTNYGTGQQEPLAYGGAADQSVVRRTLLPSGFPINSELGNEARIWSLDHWGEDLVACYYGSPIFEWNYATGPSVIAHVLPGAPSKVGSIFVSEEDRILIALGSNDIMGVFDPLLVRWCDQENNQLWIPSEDNYAGDKRAESGTRLVGTVKTGLGRLIMTDTSAYTLRFLGQPFIYELKFVAGDCGLIAQHAISTIDDIGYWMGKTGFYRYDGTVKKLSCSLQERLFGDSDTIGEISFAQSSIISAGRNKRFKEIIWSFASFDDAGLNRTIALQDSGGDAIWWPGNQARSSWFEDDQFLDYPIATKETGEICIQEFGLDDGDQPIPYRLRTAMIEIASGSTLMMISRMVFDFKRISGEHVFRVYTTDYPQSPRKVSKDYVFTGATEKIHPRMHGRALSFEMASDKLGTEFRLGVPRMAIQPRGKRFG